MTPVDRILVFGDSLSDTGGLYGLLEGVLKQPIPPDSAGYAGVFSNGLVQSAVTLDLLGADGDVYAFGGARAVGSRTVAQYLAQNGYDPDILLPNPDQGALDTDTYFTAQVLRYLHAAPADPPDAGTVATIWIGANDYNALSPTATREEVEQTVAAVVGTTVEAAAAIAQTGVGRILLYNLPSPDFLPVSLPPAFGQVVAAHNATLAQAAALLASHGIAAEIVHMNRIAGEIVGDARTFGLDPAWLDQPMRLGIASQPTWDAAAQDWVIPANPVVADVDPNRVAFMDFLHPSSATHGVLGIFAAESIAGNPILLGDGDDVRRTGPLDDLVLAGGGNDRILAQGGADTVLAGLGDDVAFGDDGNDILAGGAGADRVHGGAGHDVVAGSDGDDLQTGGSGRDLLVDGLGYDTLNGGADRDAFLYVQASALGGNDPTDGGRFVGGDGTDFLYLAVDADTRAAIRAELRAGEPSQTLDSIGVTTRSIERYVFVDPDDPASGIHTPARLHEADLWGIV